MTPQRHPSFQRGSDQEKARLHVVAGGACVRNVDGTPCHTVRVLKAKRIIAPPTAPVPLRSEYGTNLAELPGRHVEVTDVHDETTFNDTFAEEINRAEHSL